MQRNTQQLREDIDRILAGMESTGHNGDETDEEREPDTAIPYAHAQEEPGTVHVHEFTDAYVLDLPDRLIVFPKQEPLEEEEGVIDTTLAGAPAPQPPQGKAYKGSWLAYAPVSVVLLLVCFSFLHALFFPPLAHITLILKSQEVSAATTLQTGRILAPLTLAQSASVPATGKGHQDPKQATGTITFYNGQLNSVFIPAGTPFTGNDGTQIVTDQDATIPSANPPIEGQAAVPAHAVNAGTQGNIPARDLNTACCATAVLAVNLTPFQGGANERNFQFVTKSDIENAAIPLKAAVSQSVTAALQAQLKQNEQLETLPCAPQVSADHQINEEAASIQVTATLTCSGVAYNQTTLQQQATQLLTTQAFKTLGPGYSLLGTIQVNVTHALPTQTTPTLVLSLTGTWTYALSLAAQQHIKDLVKGKTYQVALRILLSLPGIERASLAWDESTKLPKDSQYIHLVVIAGIGG
jgi:Baseplate J-like protein